MGSSSWLVIMKTWLWGLLFLLWGIAEWAMVLEERTAVWFGFHCLVLVTGVVLVFVWQARNPRTDDEAVHAREPDGEPPQG